FHFESAACLTSPLCSVAIDGLRKRLCLESGAGAGRADLGPRRHSARFRDVVFAARGLAVHVQVIAAYPIVMVAALSDAPVRDESVFHFVSSSSFFAAAIPSLTWRSISGQSLRSQHESAAPKQSRASSSSVPI